MEEDSGSAANEEDPVEQPSGHTSPKFWCDAARNFEHFAGVVEDVDGFHANDGNTPDSSGSDHSDTQAGKLPETEPVLPVPSTIGVSGISNSRVTTRLRQHIARTKAWTRQASAVKFQDKLLFTVGVINFALTCYLAGSRPSWIPNLYAVKFISLISWRVYAYRKEKFGYFLLDFCYFANLLLILYLWWLPEDALFFQVVFAFSNGPLGMAVLAWRNSLVFHSLDKVTSLFMHIEPVLVTYIARHIVPNCEGSIRFHTGPVEMNRATVKLAYESMFIVAIGVYMVWQFAYWLKVQVLDKDKIKRRNTTVTTKKYVTSFIYIRDQNSALGGMVRRAPQHRQHHVFAAMQLGYIAFTLFFTPLLYFSTNAHFCYLLVMLGCSCWNGSCYYFEIFSARYQEELKQLRITAGTMDIK